MIGIKEITAKQKNVLDYIQNIVSNRGYPPTVREIGLGLGLSSPATVHGHINALVMKGYLEKETGKPRALGIVSKVAVPEFHIKVPILGRVTAGQPILAVEEREESIPVPSFIKAKEDSFALRVSGESMINAGIYDKDYIFVNKQSSAENGDIVVALIGEEVTVKRFFREKDRICLRPENDSMEPMYFTDIKILGQVIGLHRSM